jgi:hypothetical protein
MSFVSSIKSSRPEQSVLRAQYKYKSHHEASDETHEHFVNILKQVVLRFRVKYVIATFPGSLGNAMSFLSVVTCLDDQSNLIDSWNDITRMTARCCDSCRVLVLRALACLEADLISCVYGLEQVDRHIYDPRLNPAFTPHTCITDQDDVDSQEVIIATSLNDIWPLLHAHQVNCEYSSVPHPLFIQRSLRTLDGMHLTLETTTTVDSHQH